MTDVETIIDALKRKEKLVAMLAPSFPIIFSYPTIITTLKALGFSYTAEVAAGAEHTNAQLNRLLTDHPFARYVTSPCPTLVRLIRRQLPQYEKYLTKNVDSPMIATAKIVREKYPGFRPVFIGPCFVKKYEAKEDAPDLNILVLTFSELQQVIKSFALPDQSVNPKDHFDISVSGTTKLYALDGGLSNSSGAVERLGHTSVKNVSGPVNTMAALKDFDTNPAVRLLDILNCGGGCIMGPGIQSTLTPEQRKNKLLEYYVHTAS